MKGKEYENKRKGIRTDMWNYMGVRPVLAYLVGHSL